MFENQFAASVSGRLRRAFQIPSLQRGVRAALLLGTLFSPQDGPVLLLGHSYCGGVTWNGIVVTAGCNVFVPVEKSQEVHP